MRPRLTLVWLVIAAGLPVVSTAAPVAVAAPRADQNGRGALQGAVVRGVNSVRARHRMPRLRSERRLVRAASAHSADQLRSGRPSHHSSDGTPFGRRLARCLRARTIGETIAWMPAVQADMAATIVRRWLASPWHRRVLIDRRFRRLGVGARSGMMFGGLVTVVTADFATAR